MKRKYGDRRDWARILASRYAVMTLDAAEGGGVAALYRIDAVRDPATGGQEVIDADELDDALTAGKVSDALYHAAWRETHRLAPLVAQSKLPEMRMAVAHRAALLERMARA